MVPYIFKIVCEKCFWDFVRVCLQSVDYFGFYGHFNNILLIHEHRISFHLSVSSSVSLTDVLQFSVQRSFTFLVKCTS